MGGNEKRLMQLRGLGSVTLETQGVLKKTRLFSHFAAPK
jgi:hypothetical protein